MYFMTQDNVTPFESLSRTDVQKVSAGDAARAGLYSGLLSVTPTGYASRTLMPICLVWSTPRAWSNFTDLEDSPGRTEFVCQFKELPPAYRPTMRCQVRVDIINKLRSGETALCLTSENSRLPTR